MAAKFYIIARGDYFTRGEAAPSARTAPCRGSSSGSTMSRIAAQKWMKPASTCRCCRTPIPIAKLDADSAVRLARRQ